MAIRDDFAPGEVLTSADLNDTFASKLDTPGAWTSYTPTWSGFTPGNGTVSARYSQVGKTVIGDVLFTWGSTTSVTGPLDMSLPVAQRSSYALVAPFGQSVYYDVGGNVFFGSNLLIGASTVRHVVQLVSGSRVVNQEISSTVPFTWGTGDQIFCQFMYEAA